MVLLTAVGLDMDSGNVLWLLVDRDCWGGLCYHDATKFQSFLGLAQEVPQGISSIFAAAVSKTAVGDETQQVLGRIVLRIEVRWTGSDTGHYSGVSWLAIVHGV